MAAVNQLTAAQTAALVEIAIEHFMDGRGEDAREVRRIRLKLANKIGALELVGKHHKLYVERHQHDWGAGLADRSAPAIAACGEGRATSADGAWLEPEVAHLRRIAADGT